VESFRLLDWLCELTNKKWHSKIRAARPTQGEDSGGRGSLEEMFKDSWGHFTHFVKIFDLKVINRIFLYRCMLRGTAIITRDSQEGFDLVIPFCFRGKALSAGNVAAVAISLENNDMCQHFHQCNFNAFNPITLDLFDESGPTLPIIRMFFAFRTDEPRVELAQVPDSMPSSPALSSMEQEQKISRAEFPGQAQNNSLVTMETTIESGKYIAYDLFIGGVTHDTFGVIDPKENATYADLVRLHRDWFPDILDEDVEPDLHIDTLRTMCPLMHPNKHHWERFAPLDEHETEDSGSDDDPDPTLAEVVWFKTKEKP